MSDSEQGVGRNRRETSASVVLGRRARQLVAPLQQQIGAWQAEAVKLEVMAQRLRATGQTDADLAKSASAILTTSRMQARLLEEAVEAAEPAVRTHSRVTDARKVLALLIERLERILADLGEPDETHR